MGSGWSVLSRPVSPGGDGVSDWKIWNVAEDVLKEHRKGVYLELVLAGKLNAHLHQIDEECHQMMDGLVEQMKEQQGVTEELKMQDQMAWVGKMNNIRACAEEIVRTELLK